MIRLGPYEGRLTDAEGREAWRFTNYMKRKPNVAAYEAHRAVPFSGIARDRTRARAKMSEIFIRELFGVPIDMEIHDRDDCGVDTIWNGYWVQIKRFGTQTMKRGNVCFVMETNDPYAGKPPWDLGFVVEDDARDPRIWRLAGFVTRKKWLLESRLLEHLPVPCWGVTKPYPPALLDIIKLPHGRPRNPPRPWPPTRDNI